VLKRIQDESNLSRSGLVPAAASNDFADSERGNGIVMMGRAELISAILEHPCPFELGSSCLYAVRYSRRIV